MNEVTCIITETVSRTNNPPIIANTISCFVATAIAPIALPTDNDPVSPIKTIAGGALYHKKPKPEPIKAAQIIANSPVPDMKGSFKYSEKI